MRTQGIDAIEARMGWLQIDDKFQTPGIFDVEMTHLPNDQSHTIPQESTSSEMSNLKPSDATKVLSLTSFFLIWQCIRKIILGVATAFLLLVWSPFMAKLISYVYLLARETSGPDSRGTGIDREIYSLLSPSGPRESTT
ncbi:hypothetical protein EDB82DRAFT_477955 [Fusarium venenatum]|uniref:uncharacterized protein n=1 Tax=Fusarium venenatum TaxID=56646 RepID=UPI001D49336E|nr:hypothetical protein EDB82DRAFT_477955 [Fusarium venenatum]